jgi:phage FluMu gp28-like protein
VANGLYERVCLMRGWKPTPQGKEEWLDRIHRAYGPRHEAREEELEAIPRRSSGAYIPTALARRAAEPGIPVVRWAQSEGWYLDDTRMPAARIWFETHIRPLLRRLDPARRHTFGQDFGRDGDLSDIAVLEEAEAATWRTAFVIELRRIPFDVQQFILFELLDGLTRWRGALDARGNGQSHAEAAQQRFGATRVECVKATSGWYAAAFPEYKAALEDRSLILPADDDIIADHRAAVLVNGLPTMGDARYNGTDGEQRHGDSLVALLLAHRATLTEAVPIEFQSTGQPRATLATRRDFLAGMMG